MAKLVITQVKSLSRIVKGQKATVYALGLGKVNSTVVQEETPQILGMIRKVHHLVSVEKQ
jgi:large subunit ribosomal protein L30